MRIRSGEGDDQNILSSKDEQELEWKVATVVENRSATVDGNLRTLVLSIQENVRQFKGRRFGKIPSLERLESPRWIDAFNTPGQYMYVRCGGDDDNDKCVWTDRERICLSSTPYDAHKDSAFLSASIVQILVDRNGEPKEEGGLELGKLSPGDQFEVSEIFGKGFQSLFHEEYRLGPSLEAGKNLILIGSGSGIGPLRSVLEWAPVQAYAGQHNVTLIYHVESLESAAYLDNWDEWREAGIHVRPVIGSKDASIIESELFNKEGEIRIKTDNSHVLISGFPGKVTARLSRLLSQNSVLGSQVFYCDY